MPMMPMEPAKAVSSVRAFLVIRLFRLRERAVRKPMEVFLVFSSRTGSSLGV